MPYIVTRIKEFAGEQNVSFEDFYLTVLGLGKLIGRMPSKQTVQLWWEGSRAPTAYEGIIAEAQGKKILDYYGKVN